MATLFQKLRTLFKANLHEMADKAIEKSDLAVYDEYIRQAERELEQFTRTIAPMIAQVKTTKRRRDNLANKAAELDWRVDQYLKAGRRTDAMVTMNMDVDMKAEGESMEMVLDKLYHEAHSWPGIVLKKKMAPPSFDELLESVECDSKHFGVIFFLDDVDKMKRPLRQSLLSRRLCGKPGRRETFHSF